MKNLYVLLAAATLTVGAEAQPADQFGADVLHDYFDFQLELIKETPGFTPPVAARALSYTGLAAYEATVHGVGNRQSLAGALPQLEFLPEPEPEALYWPEVANIVLASVVEELFENMSAERFIELEDLRQSYSVLHAAEVSAGILTASQSYADALAADIKAYADTDGEAGCQFTNFPDFDIPVGPGLWMPPEGQQALQPYWGDKRCFVVEYVTEEMVAPAPPEFSDEFGSALYDEAMAVYNASMELTQEQIDIAEYWADGPGTVTPPGHSVSMLRQILELESSDLAFSAEAYARLGIALADAFVQCWKTKYTYNLERPITYIQAHIDPEWNTVIATPPFPEYTSGHSSQSGAFGIVMAELFGENYTFTDHTHGEQFGGPRTFTNFTDCAEETAVSRLYGGIHYPVGNVMGSESGIAIGQMTNELFEQVSLSTSALAAASDLDVFPVPAAGPIRIEGDFDMRDRIVIHDLAGRVVFQSEFQSVIDPSRADRGLYLLSVTDRSGRTLGTTKIVLN